MIVGLTGGIGSGKSTVAAMLARRGAVILDTDLIAREVVQPPSPILDALRTEFGESVIAANGKLDREALAAIVFANPERRRRLNELTHPAILERTLALIAEQPPGAVVVVVVPLLFESGFERNCDRVIAVVATADVRLRRIVERDRADAASVRRRMDAQPTDAEYESRAAIVVRNHGDLEALEGEVETAWARLNS